jgi:phosphate transport system permease protein
MIRASEEAIRTVPQSYKEGSLALGASKFRTFMTVTLPAALPGILTGIILSLSRIAGETAPILFTGAVAKGPVPDSIFDRTRTLSYGSYDMAVGDRLAMMVPHNQYGMVVTLILLILILNAMAIVLRSRVFKKLKGQ